MNTALIIALLLAGQVQPTQPAQPEKAPSSATPATASSQATSEQTDDTAEEPGQPVFTLDQIAAGAKNDAFVDEFIKDKTIKLYGRVLQVERWTTGDKSDQGYRVLMGRLSREDHAVDVEVWFMFPVESRKELAKLEPGNSRITIEGLCAGTQMQSLVNGLGLTLAIKDCKVVETPPEIDAASAPPRTSVLPVVTPNVPGLDVPSVNPTPSVPLPNAVPGPVPPPVPQQPMPLPQLPPRTME